MYLSLFIKIAANEWIHIDLMCCSQLSNFVEVDSHPYFCIKRKKGYHCLGKNLEVEVTRVAFVEFKKMKPNKTTSRLMDTYDS